MLFLNLLMKFPLPITAPHNVYTTTDMIKAGIEYKGYMYSYFISAVIGYAAAYIMNRKLTFKADANPILSTVLYTIMVICTITFNTWFGSFLGTLIKNSGHDSVFIVLLTKLIVMTVPTLWTYPLNRFVIHRKKKA